jgi:hypothetical protein
MDSIYLSIFLFFYSCFCFYSFFLPKINYSTLVKSRGSGGDNGVSGVTERGRWQTPTHDDDDDDAVFIQRIQRIQRKGKLY